MCVLTDDHSATLFSERYQETYHSTFGALTESRYVYLESSGVQARLDAGLPTHVIEIGFGLGLNFLLTADAAESTKTKLEFTSFEHDLVSPNSIADMNYHSVLKHPQLANQLVGLIPSNKVENIQTPIGRTTDLHLITIDATTWNLQNLPPAHAIYLDAFSPEHNPECWEIGFLARLVSCLAPKGKLATYCVKGQFRRDLTSLGMDVKRLPGPPGKREILVAEHP